jgi:hypothetical protein
MAKILFYAAIVIIAIIGVLAVSQAVGGYSILDRLWPWKPDFVALKLTSPSIMYAGVAYTINFTINNTGTDVTKVHTHVLERSLDNLTWTNVDNKIFNSHPSGLIRYVLFSWTPSSPGIYYLRTCADGSVGSCKKGVISESNENNNIAYGKVTVIQNQANNTTLPDFVAMAIKTPDPMYFNGNNKIINFTVYNNGSSVTSYFEHHLYWSFDNGTGDMWHEITPSVSDNIHTNFTNKTYSFSWYPAGSGIFYLRACADGIAGSIACGETGRINESNENNNIAYAKVTVYSSNNTTKPDLKVESITFTPPSPSPKGTYVNITANVSNIGNATANNFHVEFKDITNTFGGLIFVPALTSRNSMLVTWTWYANVTGMYTIKVTADVYNTVDEWDENNNVNYANYTII